MLLTAAITPQSANSQARFSMCGELVALYGLTQPVMNLQPRYNIAPTPVAIPLPMMHRFEVQSTVRP